MIRTTVFGLLLLLSLCAQADDIQIPGTNIWFEAPTHFSPLDQQDLEMKFPSRTGPRHAVGNERRTTTIAYDVRDVAITAEVLEEQLDAIGDSLGRVIPGFVSIDRGMRSWNGLSWAYFEMTSTAIDADIHNLVLMTPHDGQMVVLSFNSTKADFATLEPQLRKSISTLQARE